MGVCSKKDKTQCFDVPTTTCEKVTSQKCFTVKTPPKLVQVPKSNCGGGPTVPTGGGGGPPQIHHIHIAQPQVHHAPAHSHTHQTHFVPSVATAVPVVAAAPVVATTGYAGGVGLGGGVAAVHPGFGGGSHQSVSTPHSHHHTHV